MAINPRLPMAQIDQPNKALRGAVTNALADPELFILAKACVDTTNELTTFIGLRYFIELAAFDAEANGELPKDVLTRSLTRLRAEVESAKAALALSNYRLVVEIIPDDENEATP
jgi:hypothetical protein